MDFLVLSKPWPQRGLACLVGAAGVFGFAPFFVFPALLLSLSVAWFLLEQTLNGPAPKWRAFWLGWWFGMGHFVAGLYWLVYPLTLDIGTLWWVMPFALLGLPAVLACFTGSAFWLTTLWPYRGINQALVFAAAWVGMEWLRGHIFTGFPWNLAGYAWGFNLEMMQGASVIGVYGLSLLVLLLAVSLQYLVSRNAVQRTIVLTFYVGLGVLFMWGRERLRTPDVVDSPSHAIRIVQPSIPQALKWDPTCTEKNFQTLLTMTETPSALPIEAVIWPESSVSFFVEHQPFHCLRMAEVLPKGALLFLGAVRRTPPDVSPVKVWNSILVLDTQGEIVTYYDKSHLVPFGEYIPFHSLIDKIFGKGVVKKVTAGGTDFTQGSGPATLSLPNGLPSFAGSVCYEAIFPGKTICPWHGPAGWIVNVTNDGWYGKTTAPYQHLEMARFRAIEEGIPLVRAANSGISAVFDAYGRLIGRIGLDEKGVLDVWLPSPTRVLPLYAKCGRGLFILIGLLLATLGIAWGLSRKDL